MTVIGDWKGWKEWGIARDVYSTVHWAKTSNVGTQATSELEEGGSKCRVLTILPLHLQPPFVTTGAYRQPRPTSPAIYHDSLKKNLLYNFPTNPICGGRDCRSSLLLTPGPVASRYSHRTSLPPPFYGCDTYQTHHTINMYIYNPANPPIIIVGPNWLAREIPHLTIHSPFGYSTGSFR